MRLHVTYAGGTIGMVDSPEGLRPGADLQGWFGSQLEGIELASNITMSTLDPLIDSSEATPEDWQAIINDINAHADEADAFLVLHGTDTMAYSAAALSYALASMGKPVVLTGSQYPLGVVGSDASANVTGALRAAMSHRARGVMLFFGHKLLAGNRAILRANTFAASEMLPNPLLLVGTMPIRFGGTRQAASWSSRDTALMLKNSSLAATSEIGSNLMPSGLPLGAYNSKLRKFPGPFDNFNCSCKVSICSSSILASVKYMI